jgi:predicted PolB exonuclease-like 3'-5' exonuclease
MIAAFDIETIPNLSMCSLLPDVEPNKTLKDPEKVAADILAKKKAQIDKMGLDPLFGRVFCFAFANDEHKGGYVLSELDDDHEREMVQRIMKVIGQDGMRLVTFNGVSFDLPFVYKRAIVLGVNPANFGAPPLSAWTKRYASENHFDLMKLWCQWESGSYIGLDTLAKVLLGGGKVEIDFADFPELLKSEPGRETIYQYCLQDTRLTYQLYKRMLAGGMFA